MTPEELRAALYDPLVLFKVLWPNERIYREQRQVLRSYWANDETYVPAGNMLGKDYITARGVVMYVLTRHPVRVVTTSAKDDHLRVLWGEIGDAIAKSAYPLKVEDGGPLVCTHQTLKKVVNGTLCPLSYAIGMVASPDRIAAMQGHHVANVGDRIPRTLFVSDESSSVPDEYHRMADTWANRIWIIGNTWECQNFFYRGVKEGDRPRPFTQEDVYQWRRRSTSPGVSLASSPTETDASVTCSEKAPNGYYRKIIKIKAEQSPNVRYAMAEQAAGLKPSNRVIVPGVKSWAEYQKNRSEWDPIKQSVSLDAEFYEGAELRLWPAAWLDHAERFYHWLQANGRAQGQQVGRRRDESSPRKVRRAMGVDPGEGSANTVWTVGELGFGVLEKLAMPTPNTDDIPNQTKAMALKWGVEPEDICMDRGGGGKQHSDRLRTEGWDVRSIAFGERVVPPPQYGTRPADDRKEDRELGYVYLNRRAQMYGEASQLLDVRQYVDTTNDPNCPNPTMTGFAIPSYHYGEQYARLRHQMERIPKTYDKEGQLYVIPKSKKNPESKEKTLIEIIGYSPDELDSFVLMVHGLLHDSGVVEIGAW